MAVSIKGSSERSRAYHLLRRHAWLIGFTTLHQISALLASVWLSEPYDVKMTAWLTGAFGVMVPFFILTLMIWRVCIAAVVIRPVRPLQWLVRDILRLTTDPERMMGGMLALTCLMVVITAFTYFKIAIPEVNPFYWDIAFAEFDRVLHGGRDAYRLLWPLTGGAQITTVINAAYHFWLFLMYFVVFFACFSCSDWIGRDTFLCAFVLTWTLGGNVLATLFSSAGPVYFAQLGYGDDFVPLMDNLNRFAETSPVWALDVQKMLWEGYTSEGPVRGISAMPSMHVASATLLALYGFRRARWMGWTLTLFVVVILIGSVHLGWHYAIDGYVGVLLALVMWMVAARLPRPES